MTYASFITPYTRALQTTLLPYESKDLPTNQVFLFDGAYPEIQQVQYKDASEQKHGSRYQASSDN
jgi:hypothetical protein